MDGMQNICEYDTQYGRQHRRIWVHERNSSLYFPSSFQFTEDFLMQKEDVNPYVYNLF